MKSEGIKGVDRELLAISYENLKPMVGMNVVASGGVSTVLWLGGADWALVWFAAVAILCAGRFSFGAHLTRDIILNSSPVQSARWRRQFAIGVYASAASWAALSLLVSRSASADQFMVSMILSAMAAGGTGILAATVREGRIYIAAMVGPASLLLFNHDRQGLIMTFLG
ncbi:MAG: GGDEF-domain containing protein, partial [Sphingomonas sp.]